MSPKLVEAAKALSGQRPRLSLWKISAALADQGYVTKVVTMDNGATKGGVPYSANAVKSMLGE